MAAAAVVVVVVVVVVEVVVQMKAWVVSVQALVLLTNFLRSQAPRPTRPAR